ncbi:MAG: putative diaminopimelate decarboxylase [Candidatus Roizmanbacteria bacterium GW2011_GWA2_36_23]|uniref:Putative diaminopimelate decarboxylase n=1 Tax=Candidatus Roizmanbacteria bacterium GW2011_GWA2_36_23 TaxID=1618480 RepID=A0A0G0HDQ6_9BACT|nr:MAG: putative diaminopimelate decarboxylase [Candidatus Roizmanbacteria bacterium GW2011_GWA2_36_23]
MKKFYKLSPITHPWINNLLSDKDLLYQTVAKYGSPLYLYSIQPFLENLNNFKSILQRYLNSYRVYFARKPNHCFLFSKAAIDNNYGVDTASYRELSECIKYQANGDYIFTAAIKEEKAIILAIVNKTIIIVDNVDESRIISKIAKKIGKPAQIGIRVAGFKDNKGKKINSRFGFDIDKLPYLFQDLIQKSNVQLKGFHFHLNDYQIQSRVSALGQLIPFYQLAKKIGHHVEFIDIGGGFLVNYLKNEKEWIKFNDKLKKCVEQKNDQITYMNHPLHLSEFNNKAQKVGNLYPYFNQLNKEKVVKKVLTSKYNGVSIYSILNRNHIRLQIEPGRSSLDQSGITVARVMFRKQDIFGNWLVGLNMGFTQLLSSSSEFAVDPVVVYKNFSSLKEYVDVNFVGNYCMERDVIQRRIIRLNRLPKIGDLVIFINTAGYMSHFLATNSHLFEPPYNIFIDKNHNLQVDKYR